MAGLIKAKKYDWKDSNLALFGSDLEREIKKESAKTEEAWEGAGTKPGLQIWRIVNFQVTHWPKEQYGKFYNGDSYIILNTYKDPDGDELLYDVHFWIGAQSTQDEYGTAAYKTVELDILLDDKPVQHRQVQGFETDLFKSYFKRIQILNGGADSGFKAVGADKYQTRLLEVKIETINGKKTEIVVEKPLKKSSMNNGDVYLIDKGLHIIMWCGQDASPFEKNKAREVAITIDEDRSGKAEIEVLDDCEDINNMPESLESLLQGGACNEVGQEPCRVQPTEKVLNRLSDSTGQLQFEEVARGDAIKKSKLNSDDVFILETQRVCYVWLGKGASIEEKKNAFVYAHYYIMRSVNPFNPITVVDEGHETCGFNAAF